MALIAFPTKEETPGELRSLRNYSCHYLGGVAFLGALIGSLVILVYVSSFFFIVFWIIVDFLVLLKFFVIFTV